MTTLADIRTKVRIDLHDTDPATYRWTDDQLDRHIAHALSDLDRAMPRELSEVIVTTPGSRDLSLAGLADLVEVEAVEYPVGRYPAAYARFSRWESTLTLLVPSEPDGSDAKVFYTASHVLDGSGSTVPPSMEDPLAMGAAGYASVEIANGRIDALTIGGDHVDRDYTAWGQAWLTAYRQLLGQHDRQNRIRSRRMFVPA